MPTSFLNVPAILGGLDGQAFIAMFWFFVFIELPRYALGNVIAIIGIGSSRRRTEWNMPRLSVIVPCHNNAAGMTKTVNSLREQTMADIEIVVVDDGSDDNTVALAHDLRKRNMIDVFVSTRLRGGKSAALNLGFQHCSGEIVVCVDADTTFDRDSIERIAAIFSNPRIGAAGGNVGVRNERQSFLCAMQAVEYAISISLGRKVSMMLGILPIISGAFSAYRRASLVSVGGWEPGPGEDADLTMKLRRAGWEIGFAIDARALTDAPVKFAALLRQRLRWEGDLLRIHARKYRSLLAPWSRDFSFRETLGTLDVLVFSVAPTFAFCTYVLWLVTKFGAASLTFLLISIVVYSLLGVATFLLGITLARAPGAWRLLPYAFAYGIYCVYVLHPIRLWAYVGELTFDRSYRSQFVPKKVLDQIGRF